MASGEVKLVNGKRVATPEYRSWQMMKNRVLNPRAVDFKYYGARGIGIDPEWLEFGKFLADMGRRPTPKHTLERVDGEGPYCAANCKWATRQEQSRNREYCVLNYDMAQAIRRRYANGTWTQEGLATEYGVTQTTISQIILMKSWRP